MRRACLSIWLRMPLRRFATEGTDARAADTQELEADIMPIDMLIGFAQPEVGKTYFGEDTAGIAAHAIEIKATETKHCGCPACAIVAEIFEKKQTC